MSDDEPTRLGPLRPQSAPARMERLIQTLIDAAEPELVRRRARRDVLGQIAEWRRPTLLAAIILVAISVGLMLQDRHASSARGTRTTSLAATVGVPDPLVSWAEGESPEMTSLVLLNWREGR